MMFMGPIEERVAEQPGLRAMIRWTSASLVTVTRIPCRANDGGEACAGGTAPGHVEQAMASSLEGANR